MPTRQGRLKGMDNSGDTDNNPDLLCLQHAASSQISDYGLNVHRQSHTTPKCLDLHCFLVGLVQRFRPLRIVGK